MTCAQQGIRLMRVSTCYPLLLLLSADLPGVAWYSARQWQHGSSIPWYSTSYTCSYRAHKGAPREPRAHKDETQS